MTDTQTTVPQLGLALGGGGIRGLAHIGVLKVLEQESIPISVIAGTSMGGLIAAAYGAGLSATALEAEMVRLAHFDQLIRLADWRFSRRGLIRGDQLQAYFAELVGADLTFTDLSLPVSLVTVDLDRATEVVLNQGLVVDAMRATMSIPGVFVPVEIGGRRLVDGGILNNVPVNVIHQYKNHLADIIVAVDVMPARNHAEQNSKAALFPSIDLSPFPSIAQNTGQMIFIMLAAQTETNLREVPPDLLLRPQLPPDITLFWGLDRAKEVIKFGEQAMIAQLPALKERLKQ